MSRSPSDNAYGKELPDVGQHNTIETRPMPSRHDFDWDELARLVKAVCDAWDVAPSEAICADPDLTAVLNKLQAFLETNKRAQTMSDLVDRIRNRMHDAPMLTERLLDDAADELERLRGVISALRATATNARDMIQQQGRSANDVIGMIHRQIAIAGDALKNGS